MNAGQVFTGEDLCIVASEALLGCVTDLMNSRKMSPGLASLTLNPLHQIVRIEVHNSSDVLLLDPTYRQINPNSAEDILVFRPSQIPEYYPSNITGQPVPEIIDRNFSSWTFKNIPPKEVLDAKNEIVRSVKNQ